MADLCAILLAVLAVLFVPHSQAICGYEVKEILI